MYKSIFRRLKERFRDVTSVSFLSLKYNQAVLGLHPTMGNESNFCDWTPEPCVLIRKSQHPCIGRVMLV